MNSPTNDAMPRVAFFSDSLPIYLTRAYLTIGITIISLLFFIVTFNDIFYK